MEPRLYLVPSHISPDPHAAMNRALPNTVDVLCIQFTSSTVTSLSAVFVFVVSRL